MPNVLIVEDSIVFRETLARILVNSFPSVTITEAGNNGRVIFVGRMGIYGNTVVLDHGQRLASSYSHLSKINVSVADTVRKGETIVETGRTGLAGGDHLHFAVMVNGIFVNPIEWWDSHWIHDNISRKLTLLEKQLMKP